MKNTAASDKKHRFNIVDVIVIIVLLALAATAAYLFLGGNAKRISAEEHILNTVIKLENVPEQYHDLIKSGDTICDDSTGAVIGNGEYVEYEKASVSLYDSELKYYKEYEYPDRENVFVHAVCIAEFKNGHYKIDGVNLGAGKIIQLRAPGFTYAGEIIVVEEYVPEAVTSDSASVSAAS